MSEAPSTSPLRRSVRRVATLLTDADTGDGTETPIVPRTGVEGRALTFVVTAMCFLACLCLATMISAERSAERWTADIRAEVTIQIAAAEGRDMAADVQTVIDIAQATPGVDRARATGTDDITALLAPWLGEDFQIEALPVPRLIVVTLDPNNAPDLAALSDRLTAAVPGASLDDHRFWQDRLRAGARTVVIIGGLLFLLVVAVTVATIIFATRGAMASNREVIEVLYFVGAPHGFIASEFQRHFLLVGLRAGVMGGLAGIVMLSLVGLTLKRLSGAGQAEEVRILVGDFGVDAATLLGVAAIVALVALLTALTSRITVFRTLDAIE